MSNDLAAAGLDKIQSLKAANVRSLVCVSMEAFDQRAGVIYADASNPRVTFERKHIDLLKALGTIAVLAFDHAVEFERLEAENSRLQEDADIRHELIGDSSAIAKLSKLIAKAARTDSTVLITGESGTGKELVARGIHRKSQRFGRAFVPINCAVVADNLLENELFGHEKGAFTGALSLKKGIIEEADGGTLFLDEFGEIPMGLQAKLLRVIQEQEFQRVGGTRTIKVNVRLIVATNKDLAAAVAKGEFREDLYQRVKVVTIKTAPLRERPEDIMVLAHHFLARSAKKAGRTIHGFSEDAARALQKYDWPGNVRELQNAIEHGVVMGEAARLLAEDLPDEILETLPDSDLPKLHQAVKALKRELVTKAMAKTGGTVKDAAKLLGVELKYVYRLMRNLGLDHLRDRAAHRAKR